MDLGWLLQTASADLTSQFQTGSVHWVHQESTLPQQQSKERPALSTPEPNQFHLIFHLIPPEETIVDKHKTIQQAPSSMVPPQMTQATIQAYPRARITMRDISKRTIARGSSSRLTWRSNSYHREKRCIRHMTRGLRSTSSSWHGRRR